MEMKGLDSFIWLRTGKGSWLHKPKGISWPGNFQLLRKNATLWIFIVAPCIS